MANPALSVIIPAYNESERIEPTLRSCVDYCRGRDLTFELIVVDDGSRDDTSDVVRRAGKDYPELQLIRLPANRGKGYAVRTGMVNSRGQLALFMDADGSTPMAELERLEEAVRDGAKVAIGSRALASNATQVTAKWYRRLMGRTFHYFVSLLTVRGFLDTQCGFKLFTSDAAHELFSRMRINGFSFDVEVLLMAHVHGYKIREVPVNWVHQPGSKVNMVTDSLRMLRDLFIMRTSLMRGMYAMPHVAPMSAPPA